MDSEKRRPETASLRNFFQCQLERITELVDGYAAQRQETKQRNTAEAAAVESVVKATDPRLRIVSAYRKRLRVVVRGLLDYVDQVVDRVPPAVKVNQQSFLSDPQVNAFFVNKMSICELFSRSSELQHFFSKPENSSVEEAYAIMYMARDEKEVLSAGLDDGLLVRDVKRKTISFTDHVIKQPRASESESRSALRQYLFEKVVEYINYQLIHLNAALGRKVLNDPSIYLDALERAIGRPEELLRLESITMRIDRMGFSVDEYSNEAVNVFTLYELGLGEQATQAIVLVVYPKTEMESRDALLRAAELSLR